MANHVRNAFGFGAEEAALAADLYRRLPRPRNREIDLAIAACAISSGAALWTTNPRDFADIPGLTLALSREPLAVDCGSSAAALC